jgi:REP element-mobilizing transposase RayT
MRNAFGFRLGLVRLILQPKGLPQASPGHRPGDAGNGIQALKGRDKTGDSNYASAMPQSLSRMVVHLVFSTKNREPILRNGELRIRLHAYMAGILQELHCDPILINGVEDHVHVLCNLSRTLALAKVVEELKKSSSKWMKEQGAGFSGFHWQAGYGAFSVSQSNVESVRNYIAGQEEHHRTVTFQEEYRAFCRRHGVALDERYAWD